MLADARQTHRPARVGLVNLASGRGRGVVRLLLDDLAEAGAVYERLSGVADPVEFGAAGPASGAADPADVYVLGFYAEGGAVASEDEAADDCAGDAGQAPVAASENDHAEELAAKSARDIEPASGEGLAGVPGDGLARTLFRLEPGTQVYVVVCCDSCDADEAWDAVSGLEKQCSEAGLLWCGGMVVPGAANLPRVWGKPRMGWARRRVSEVTDELLLAIRCGEPAGTIVVRPRLSWRLR